MAVLLLAFGCGDDEDNPNGPGTGQFTVTLRNLPELGEEPYYEAWVRFPDSSAVRGLGTLHDDGELVALGAFRVAQGTLHSLTGGAATFALLEPKDLNFAEEVLITVHMGATNDTTGPVIIGGEVTGDDTTGRATLTADYADALAANLRLAAGSCVLATPTDEPGGNQTRGIWFTNAAGDTVALDLPRLGEGWSYEGWILNQSANVSLGNFTNPNGPDSDGAGPAAGVEPGFAAPGSDFVNPARSLADGETVVFIAVRPGGHDDGLRLDEAGPFPLKVLELGVPLNAAPRVPMTMNVSQTPLPDGTVTFTR